MIEPLSYILPVISFPLLVVMTARSAVSWRRRQWAIIPQIMLVGIAVLTLILGSLLFWYTHRPRPDDTQRRVFQGVEYLRDVRDAPRPMIVHVVRIDLDAPGISFLVTPGDEGDGYNLSAQTTSQFLQANDLQIAINGDFFDPWWDYGPWNYYPHEGDGVNVRGLTASRGEVYARGYARTTGTLYISEDNRVTFNTPSVPIYNALSGYLMLLMDGERQSFTLRDPYVTSAHPRTAVGIDATGRTLILVVIDGRQPNYSEGATIPELAQIMTDYGAYTALNLDGGGSATLVIEGDDGQPDVLNSPIHTHLPGRERPIATYLGVYAAQVDSH